MLAALPGALAAGWAAAVAAGGPDPAQWRWGDQHRAVRVHPLSGAGVPSSCHPTPRRTACRWAATPTPSRRPGTRWRPGSPFTVTSLSVYRQVVDLGDPGSASFVIPGGASGDPDSAHYADQFERWAAHERIPMAAAAA